MLQQRARQTGVMPQALLRRPKLKRGDQEYLEAFFSLSRARPVGMGGPCAILFSELLAYILLVGIDCVAERLKYVSLIQRLDAAYLGFVSDRAERKNKK